MTPILLIDADEYIYRACAAVEKDVRWDAQNHVLVSNAEEAWDVLAASLERLFKRFESRECVMALSTIDKPNFRLAIDPTYKGNRVRKPLCYGAMRQRMHDKFNCVVMDGLEADDICGILATKPQKSKRPRIIVSQDKDMKTIPATVWNRKDLVTYTEAEADYWHLFQTLTGDVTDGYKGCPGMGPAGAAAVLQQAFGIKTLDDLKVDSISASVLKDAWTLVVKTFADVKGKDKKPLGLTEADALRNARLARILRWDDWDSNKKEPILWAPHVS